MNQGPLSELERNVTLFGKNVVTIPTLTASQSMKKEANFQYLGWAGTEIQPERENISPHYEAQLK